MVFMTIYVYKFPRFILYDVISSIYDAFHNIQPLISAIDNEH